MSTNDNAVYEPAIYLSLSEVEKQAVKHKGNPIIQQLLFLMREKFGKRHCHVAKYVDGRRVDTCDECGLDLRDEIHLRVGEIA